MRHHNAWLRIGQYGKIEEEPENSALPSKSTYGAVRDYVREIGLILADILAAANKTKLILEGAKGTWSWKKDKRGYNGSADVTVHVIVEQTWVKEGENPIANEQDRGTRKYIVSPGESRIVIA